MSTSINLIKKFRVDKSSAVIGFWIFRTYLEMKQPDKILSVFHNVEVNVFSELKSYQSSRQLCFKLDVT